LRITPISEAKTLNYFLKRRDAREAEGARLEIVYSANNGIEGSATPPEAGEAEGAKRLSTSLSFGDSL